MATDDSMCCFWRGEGSRGSRALHGLVIDNGRGFVVSERDRPPSHIGLLAVNERSLLGDGWAKIERDPGLGTRIEFRVPMS